MPSSPTGPSTATIAFVGEAPGEQEDLLGVPFIGASGTLLASCLHEAGVDPRPAPRNPLSMIQYWRTGPYFITNVVHERPPKNKFEDLLVAKRGLPADCPHVMIKPGKYLPPRLADSVERLRAELAALPQLNLVVALGGTAASVLCGSSKIKSIRGYISHCTLHPAKVLPVYHPAAVLREWSLRVQLIADLQKIPAASRSRELTRKSRRIAIAESVDDIIWFRDSLDPAQVLSFDIETARGQITCIGFAQAQNFAFVVPITDQSKPSGSYWEHHSTEVSVWRLIREILAHPCPKVTQNGLYDVQWLWRRYGIPVHNWCHDTMLLHHSMYPELEKGLGFLGSHYAEDLGNWKDMRSAHQSETKGNE